MNDIAFKTKFGGYQKQEVDEYIANLRNSMEASVSSYEEKIDELKNNLKMMTHELETTKKDYAVLEVDYDLVCQKMQLVADQSDNIEKLMRENEQLKQHIEENENFVMLAAELKMKNTVLLQNIEQCTADAVQYSDQIKLLEDTIYTNSQKSTENDRRSKVAVAELNAQLEMKEEKHRSELAHLSLLADKLSESIAVFYKKN